MTTITPVSQGINTPIHPPQLGDAKTNRAIPKDFNNAIPWRDTLKKLDSQLLDFDLKAQRLSGKLPSEMSKMLQLQMQINQAQVDTQLAVKIADAISSCIKRVQQMGSGA